MWGFDVSSRYIKLVNVRSLGDGEVNVRKADALEFAILGLLHEAPMHGYELRKQLSSALGPFHAISYGSLYPALKALVASGAIEEQADAKCTGNRPRTTYRLTGAGEQRFKVLVDNPGPESWEDDGFGVHFAFFARTPADVRTSILEGRRMRLAERRALLRDSLTRARERVDAYTLELQRHGLDGVELEMRWLDELIAAEQREQN